jgi:hypothetical protein
MKSESEVQTEILLAGPEMGLRLLRNNVGVMQDERGNFVRYGVGGKGGSDLMGWYAHGTSAIFTVVEVKREDWKPPSETAQGADAVRYRKQRTFLYAVGRAGGIACFATSVQDVRDAITAWLRDR